jgi:ribonuclease BN (tRNA processing enzyme)
MSDLDKLIKLRAQYENELEELHIYEPSIEWYRVKRFELEWKIASVEEAIDTLEKEMNRRVTALKVMLFALTSVLVIMITYLLLS